VRDKYGTNDSREIDLMIARARCGQHDAAATTARVLQAKHPRDAAVLFQVACGYALCAPAVAHGKKAEAITAADRDKQREFVELALTALTQARANGYKDARGLETDPDLESVRSDPRFQRLIEEIKVGSPSGPKP
jgi:hypothetical protein